MGSPPKIVYIGGHGRSGTTIVDRVLSEVTGAFSAGEVHRFWEYGLARDWTCSCGAPLRECPFWSDVLQRSFSAAGCTESEILEAWKTVARPKSVIPLHYPALRSTRFQRRLSSYRSFLSTFYEVVAQHSGKELIVDSSGSPLHGYVIRGISEVDVVMLHIVRDARAVAYSNRKDKPNPSKTDEEAKMKKKSAIRVSLTWLLYNKMLSNVGSSLKSYANRKYENIFEDPKKEFVKIVNKLGLECKVKNKIHEGNIIELKKGHNGQGNPVRYKQGKTKLYKDESWRKNMKNTRKCVVSLICKIGLRKYSYV